MRLEDLFTHIAHRATSTADRELKYDIVRSLIQNRTEFGIENNVNDLLTNFNTIKAELEQHYEGEDIDQNLKDLIAYQNMSVDSSSDEEEVEDTTKTTTDDEDTTADEYDEKEETDADDASSDSSEYYEVTIKPDPFVYSLLFANLVVGIAVLLRVW